MMGDRRLWLISIAISLVLLVIVVWQFDLTTFAHVTMDIGPGWLMLIGLCLTLEACCSSARLWLLSPSRDRVSAISALHANAWYGIYLIALPARLGEVAVLGAMSRYLGYSAGEALASIVVQRLLDVVTVVVLALLITGALMLTEYLWVLLMALGVLIVAVLALVNLGALFGVCIAIAGRLSWHWTDRFASALADGHRWLHLSFVRKSYTTLIALTQLKWLTGIAAIWGLLVAINGDPLAMVFVAVPGVLLAAIPLPTIGGIGFMDVGILSLLVVSGVDPGVAAATVICLRGISIIFAVAMIGVTQTLMSLVPGGLRV